MRRAACLVAAFAVVALVVADCARPAVERADTRTPAASSVTTVANVGFRGPENVVYDSLADVFLVSNVNGGPSARDGNGFVSRVAADGRVLVLRWIAGGVRGVVLDAPKGLAVRGDTLAIADVGGVRLFDRRTGAPLTTITLPGLVMNDLAFAGDGALWITDTGPDRGITPIDTTRDLDAVWRVAASGRVEAVARGLALDRPDGIVLQGGGVLVATFGGHRLEHVGGAASDGWDTAVELPAGRVDGLRRLPDASLLITSWDARAVWHRALDGSLTALLTDVPSPAGIALDTRRQRVAVTSMEGNALYLVPLR